MPEGLVVTREDGSPEYNGPFPAVVKPTRMENSVGVELVHDKDEMEEALEGAWQYGDAAVVDTFKAGREVRCGAVELVDGKVMALGCIEYKVAKNEIVSKIKFPLKNSISVLSYDKVAKDEIRRYEEKLEGSNDQLRLAAGSSATRFIEESEEPKLVRKLQQIAVRIHQVLGCRDFSQYDCRVTEEGKVYVLEVNSFCSFGPLSLLTRLASREGISPGKLYNSLLERAASRGRGLFATEF